VIAVPNQALQVGLFCRDTNIPPPAAKANGDKRVDIRSLKRIAAQIFSLCTAKLLTKKRP